VTSSSRSRRSVRRVREALGELGIDAEVIELSRSTRTAQLAAEALEVPLGSIVKSLVLMADDRPVLALVAGDRRVSLEAVAREMGAEQARMADADEVREVTGFAIGGVPPLGHKQQLPVLIDESLSRFQILHAAAGSPSSVFPICFDDILSVSAGRLCQIAEVPE